MQFLGFDVPEEPAEHVRKDNRWRPTPQAPPRQLHLGEQEATDPDQLDAESLAAWLEALEVLAERDLSYMHEMFSRRTGSARRAHDQLIIDGARKQAEAEWEEFKALHAFATDAEIFAAARTKALDDIAFWQLMGMWDKIESSNSLSPEDIKSFRQIIALTIYRHTDPTSSDGFAVYGNAPAQVWDQTHPDRKRKRRR